MTEGVTIIIPSISRSYFPPEYAFISNKCVPVRRFAVFAAVIEIVISPLAAFVIEQVKFPDVLGDNSDLLRDPVITYPATF